MKGGEERRRGTGSGKEMTKRSGKERRVGRGGGVSGMDYINDSSNL